MNPMEGITNQAVTAIARMGCEAGAYPLLRHSVPAAPRRTRDTLRTRAASYPLFLRKRYAAPGTT
jgi:hypothetical protein